MWVVLWLAGFPNSESYSPHLDQAGKSPFEHNHTVCPLLICLQTLMPFKTVSSARPDSPSLPKLFILSPHLCTVFTTNTSIFQIHFPSVVKLEKGMSAN